MSYNTKCVKKLNLKKHTSLLFNRIKLKLTKHINSIQHSFHYNKSNNQLIRI